MDFEGASVFLKKLAAGAAMQLSTRQVYALYTTETASHVRWPLFYGSLSHYMQLYLMDTSVWVLAYANVIFLYSHITTQHLWLKASSFAFPWIFHVGLLQGIPSCGALSVIYSMAKCWCMLLHQERQHTKTTIKRPCPQSSIRF